MSPSSQIFGPFPSQIKSKEKIVYLTFDDGPNEPYTSKIINYLDSKNIKATFFIVGECAKRYPKIVKKIHDSGHSIGNHTMSHSFIKYFKLSKILNDIKANQKIIKQIVGEEPELFRPPWLFRYPSLLDSVGNMGLRTISGVFCHELEIFQISSNAISNRAIKKARPGQIIIFHDGYDSKGANREQTFEAVKQTVEILQSQGYKFRKLI